MPKYKAALLMLMSVLITPCNTFGAEPDLKGRISIENPKSLKELVGVCTEVLAHEATNELPRREVYSLQLSSEKYLEARTNIDLETDSVREFNPWVAELYTILHKLYVDTKILQNSSNLTFEKAIEKSFDTAYVSVNEPYRAYFSDSFPMNEENLKTQFEQKLKNYNQQEYNYSSAKDLCLNYSRWKIAKEINPFIPPLIEQQELKLFTKIEDVVLTMEDGEKLHATVILPKGKKVHSSILVYSLYAGGWSIEQKIKEAALHGYAGVLVYGRGKGNSKSNIIPYEHEAGDSYQIIDWISHQPWSNGKVGMYGASYLGFAQWAATKKLHPALKTIVPSAAVVPGINDNLTENGVLNTSSLSWFHLVGNTPWMDFGAYFDSRWQALESLWYKKGAPFKSLDAMDNNPNHLFQRWLAHPNYDKYWQAMVPYKTDFSAINIPILATTGYFDHAQAGSLYYFKQHYKYNKNANHHLLIGPYNHLGSGNMPAPSVLGYTIDKAAHININDLVYKWFDYVLQGKKKPSILKNKVNFQMLGTNQWTHVKSLKDMSNAALKYFLTNSKGNNFFRLSEELDDNAKGILQVVDFKDRALTNDSLGNMIVTTGLKVDNGLVFTGPVYKDSVHISGQFSGELSLTTNKKDLDFVVVLYEKVPNGELFKLSHYKGRASYSQGSESRKLLTPNEMQIIKFENTSLISKKFKPGSRLIVVLNVNKTMHDQVNYGTGGNVNSESISDANEPLTVVWHNESFINIPVLK